jgi:hypothetical protein
LFSKEGGRATTAIVSALTGVGVLLWLFSLFSPKANETADWLTLVKFAIALAIAFGVAAMVRFALAPLVSGDAPPPASAADADVVLRSRMAPIVLGIGSAAIIVLALGLVIEFGWLETQQNTDPAIKGKIDTLLTGVFASVLPVFATWVGTVIAFYFTNESFRQAAEATRETTAGLTDRLRSIPARTAMVPRARMIVLQLPVGGSLDSTVLKTIDDKFNGADVGANGVRISRLAILDSSDIFVAMIHRSVWMEILNIGLQKTPPVDVSTALLGPLIDQTLSADPKDGTYRDIVRKAVAFVSADQTLADAKAAMDAVTGCQDVIVTQSGAPTMAVIGWIMNTDIGRLSQA